MRGGTEKVREMKVNVNREITTRGECAGILPLETLPNRRGSELFGSRESP